MQCIKYFFEKYMHIDDMNDNGFLSKLSNAFKTLNKKKEERSDKNITMHQTYVLNCLYYLLLLVDASYLEYNDMNYKSLPSFVQKILDSWRKTRHHPHQCLRSKLV